MTRGEFVAELINIWEESSQLMEAKGEDSSAKEIKIAVAVLKRTYAVTELVS